MAWVAKGFTPGESVALRESDDGGVIFTDRTMGDQFAPTSTAAAGADGTISLAPTKKYRSALGLASGRRVLMIEET